MRLKFNVLPHFSIACFIVGAALLGACTGTNVPAGTETAGPLDQASPTATLGPTISATATPVPAEPTATSTPSVLHSDGPYLLFEGDDGVWLANPDGSALTRISDEGTGWANAHAALSPDGSTLAYIIRNSEGLALKLLSLPDGTLRTVAQVLQITEEQKIDYTPGSSAFVYMAIERYANLDWRPDGSQLAFIGAMDGPSADLYLYDLESDQITRLSSGGSQGIAPSWSPDGVYLLHFGGSWVPPFGGAIVGYNRFDGTWAVRVSDGAITTMPKPYDSHFNFLGWFDETHYLVHRTTERCYLDGLYSIDVTSGAMSPLLEGCFDSDAVLSPDRAVLFSPLTSCDTCSADPGVFLLPYGESQAVKISDQGAYQFRWMRDEGLFYAYPVGLFSEDGSQFYEPPVPGSSFSPAVSRTGYAAWEVIEDQLGRVMVGVPGEDFRKVLDEVSVGVMIWDPLDGDTLFIANSDGILYRVKAPDFVPELIGDFGSWVTQAIWLP